jgi:hypothetical protein
MDQYIGFDVSDKKVSVCVVQAGHQDRFAELKLDMDTLKRWLAQQRRGGDRLHLTFEVSGQSGWMYDGLVDKVERLVVGNPYEMTWMYGARRIFVGHGPPPAAGAGQKSKNIGAQRLNHHRAASSHCSARAAKSANPVSQSPLRSADGHRSKTYADPELPPKSSSRYDPITTLFPSIETEQAK